MAKSLKRLRWEIGNRLQGKPSLGEIGIKRLDRAEDLIARARTGDLEPLEADELRSLAGQIQMDGYSIDRNQVEQYIQEGTARNPSDPSTSGDFRLGDFNLLVNRARAGEELNLQEQGELIGLADELSKDRYPQVDLDEVENYARDYMETHGIQRIPKEIEQNPNIYDKELRERARQQNEYWDNRGLPYRTDEDLISFGKEDPPNFDNEPNPQTETEFTWGSHKTEEENLQETQRYLHAMANSQEYVFTNPDAVVIESNNAPEIKERPMQERGL